MTGNAMSCSDIRPGVPRMLIARAILAAKRLGEAMDACLLPLRASNYNKLNELKAWIGKGRPCHAFWAEHALKPWSAALPDEAA